MPSLLFGYETHTRLAQYKRKAILQVFAREVIEKVGELEQEKDKTEKAFHDFLPPCVVRDIKRKKVSAEEFDCVTVFYGDICDFNDLTRDCSPSEVGSLL